MRIQTNSKIERVLIFDLVAHEDRTVVAWLIVHGWKEIVPTEEGRLILPRMDRDGVVLEELFSTCEGRFDAVISPAAYLATVNWLLKGAVPSVSVELEPPHGIGSYMIRRGDALDPVYVSAHVYSELHAAVLVRDMYGSDTLPHLIQRARKRCREHS